ncbi:MAG: MATE family efflux transporter [Clostridia bacterium]|nr:MATE family efflux transporter [Clostridia bacterium]
MDRLFEKKDIRNLLVPIIVEQVLVILVGIADVAMIAHVGETAVSAVSLVDSISYMIQNLFVALTTGGAVVCAQALGKRDLDRVCSSGNQLLLLAGLIGMMFMIAAVIGNKFWLGLFFSDAEADVLADSRIYFFYSALTYPFLGIYTAAAALLRAIGKSKVSMKTALCMNAVNVAGNAFCIYILKMGVAGVAIPTLIARVFAAILVVRILIRDRGEVRLISERWYRMDFRLAKKIFSIALPNCVESIVYQLGKVQVQSIISGMGTVTIAAYAVSNNINSIEHQLGNAVCLAITTVAGQCVGAKKFEEGIADTKYLVRVGTLIMAVLSTLIVVCRWPLVSLYQLSTQGQQTAVELMVISSIVMLLWPLSFGIPTALLAASDVKITMVIAPFSIWVFRVGVSYLCIKLFHGSIHYVWLAMLTEWLFRIIVFGYRFSTRRLRPKDLYLAEKRQTKAAG